MCPILRSGSAKEFNIHLQIMFVLLTLTCFFQHIGQRINFNFHSVNFPNLSFGTRLLQEIDDMVRKSQRSHWNQNVFHHLLWGDTPVTIGWWDT
jgi:hypothetical protein